MESVLLAILGIALVDSINPSALVVTIFLLSGPDPRTRVPVYVAGIFVAYLSAGIALMLGLDALLGTLDEWSERRVVRVAQAIVGAALLAYALLARSGKQARPVRRPESFGRGALFMFGIGVTAVEFSTALPYLGAIGLLLDAGVGPATWLPILIVYNVIFVTPPLLLLAFHGRLGSRGQLRLTRLRQRLEGGRREVWLWILGIVGVLLLVNALNALT